MSDDFRTAARTLQPYISDTYNLLTAADAVVAAFCDSAPAAVLTDESDLAAHAARVQWVLNSPAVLAMLAADRQIWAIKMVRAECPINGGLRQSKDAVEDPRVMTFVRNFVTALSGEGFYISGPPKALS